MNMYLSDNNPENENQFDRKYQSPYHVLKTLADIPNEEWLEFQAICSPRAYQKNDYFAESGKETELIGYCISGLFRLYYETSEGEDYNKSFCAENEFISSYSSLLLSSPSILSIQALEPSELIVFRYTDWINIQERHICWERIGRKLAEAAFIKKEGRERKLLLQSAKINYQNFLEEYPNLHERIPLYHIASYLGITSVALSRIRRKIAEKKS